MGEKKGREGGVEGIFNGLSDLIERLDQLSEKGGELPRTIQFSKEDSASGLKGIFGFSVKVGLGGRGMEVEPFGNIGRDERTGKSVVREVREPMVDVIEEEDHIRVVAEMPGISPEDVRLEVRDDLLTLIAEKGPKRYRKEVLLPRVCPRERMQVSGKNGILEIQCRP